MINSLRHRFQKSWRDAYLVIEVKLSADPAHNNLVSKRKFDDRLQSNQSVNDTRLSPNRFAAKQPIHLLAPEVGNRRRVINLGRMVKVSREEPVHQSNRAEEVGPLNKPSQAFANHE
jgi:hypothetical protein